MSVWVVIPAYKPGEALAEVARALASEGASLIVVNDGSGVAFGGVFAGLAGIPGLTLLEHGVNRGKGAALKTGLAEFLRVSEAGDVVVTADADGQHLPADILAVARRGGAEEGVLVLGVRAFDQKVPLRSRFGNFMTRHLLRLVTGHRLHDTQTGLRALPRGLIPALLRLRSGGYVFELEMLMAAGYVGAPVRTVPIRTVYLDGNESSHFRPVVDSWRIYRVLLRGPGAVALAGVVNVLLVSALAWMGWPLPLAHAAARVGGYAAGLPGVLRESGHGGRGAGSVAARWGLVCVLGLAVSLAVLMPLAPVVGAWWARVIAEAAACVPMAAAARAWIWRVRPRPAGLAAAPMPAPAEVRG